MLRKGLKYGFSLLLLLIIGYNSVYIKDLNEVKAAAAAGKFNAAEYAQKFWQEKLTPGLTKAVDLPELLQNLQANPDEAFKTHGHALGIGNLKYFLVKGTGQITAISENDVTVTLQPATNDSNIRLQTEFVYGNAIRDALGVINMNDFDNTMDMNNVSAEINKKIRTEIIPPFKAQAKTGNQVQFIGAIELNQAHLRLQEIEIIPVSLALVQK